jgi:hypothetical protein
VADASVDVAHVDGVPTAGMVAPVCLVLGRVENDLAYAVRVAKAPVLLQVRRIDEVVDHDREAGVPVPPRHVDRCSPCQCELVGDLRTPFGSGKYPP